jgi:hypothetical protein
MYNDIYMRDWWDDFGQVPYAGQMVYQSPDIIPYGTSQMPNFQQALVNTYGSNVDQGKPLAANLANYIYVRGKNLGQNPSAGTVGLYWSKSSLLLMPSTWQNQPLSVVGGGTASPISAAGGAIAAGQAPFYWVPPAISGGYHYCLIARVVTPANPNALPPPPPVSTSAQFVQWVQGNAAVSWRNLALIGPGSMATRCAMDFSNPDTQSNQVFVQAQCTGLPLQSVVSFSCPLTTPNFNLNTVSATITQSTQYVTGSGTLDANAASTLFVNVQAPSGGSSLTGTVSCTYWLQVLPGTKNREHRALMPFSHDPLVVGLDHPSLDTNPGRVVMLGNVNIGFT